MLKAGVQRKIKRLRIRWRLIELERERLKLVADHATITYDSSPDDFPLWYHQEVLSAGNPLLRAIDDIEVEIRRLHDELKQTLRAERSRR